MEPSQQVEQDPLTAHGRKRGKRFEDRHQAGDGQFIASEAGKSKHEIGKFRISKNLESKSQLKAWTDQHGFDLSVENKGQHWILRGKDLTAHWWPSTAKLVLNRRFTDGISTHGWRQVCAILEQVQRTGEWNSISLVDGRGSPQ